MAYDFVGRHNYQDLMNIALISLGVKLSPEEQDRLVRYRRNWNFYEGFHWEEIPDTGKPEITENYCRAFANKMVAFELGKGFHIKMKPHVEEKLLPYLNDVWDNMNARNQICVEFGQMKSVTGDAWLQVVYESKFNEDGTRNKAFHDPYDEYEKGRVRILVVPSNIAFPEYEDGYDKDKLIRLTIMYPIRMNPREFNNNTKTVVYKQVWDNEKVEVYHGQELIGTYANKYGVIPFFHFRNLPLAGRTHGLSDLEDIIPLNMELNLKKSDISEIIDYHSAPITIVYGARMGQLEKGANKVWGGLPKDAKVENLSLEGDLKASVGYIDSLKTAMHEVGGVPEQALGKELSISNTSGVALEVTMMPLLEKVAKKRSATSEALELVNKLILKIGMEEGLITDIDGDSVDISQIKPRDFYYNEVLFEDSLPKDLLVQLQCLQLEMKLGLADRGEGMKRLGKKDIQLRLREIDSDRELYPEIYGLMTELEEEALKEKVESSKTEGKDIMKRGLNENKAGNDAQVNAGTQNSPKAKLETNSK